MAITDIQATVSNFTGVSPSANTVEDAQRFVVASVPKDLLRWSSTLTSPSSHGGNTSQGVNVVMPTATDSILDVSRNGFSAIEVQYNMKGFIANTASLHLATNTFPKYYLDNAVTDKGVIVIVKPIPTDSETVRVLYVDFSKIDDDCDLRNAVIFRATAAEFEKLSSGKIIDWTDLVTPVPPSTPSFGGDLTISSVSPVSPASPSFTYTDVSISDIVQPLIGISDMATAESVPTYTKPTVVLSTLSSIGDLSISAVSPVTPSISAASVTITGTAPTYTTPVISLTTFPTITWSFPAVPVSPTTSSQTVATFSNVPTFTPPVMGPLDFADTEDLITNEEDSEMLSARVSEIQVKISEFQVRLGETQAKFNKENSIFQADVQEKVQEAQLADANEARKLQKFQMEVGNYQAEVNKVVSGNQGEVGEWQVRSSTDIQKYGADIQNELNKFNKENAEYQALLQKDIQDAQLTDANEAKKLQKYSSEIQDYQADVNTEVQEFSNNFQKNIQVFQQENQVKLGEYQANIQNELNEFNKENVIYQQDIAKKTQNFQKDIQEAVQNAQNDFNSKKSNLDKDVQIGLQNAINNFQEDVQEYNASLQKFGSELTKYQNDTNKEVQDYTNTLGKNVQEYQSEVALYGSNLQKYQGEVGEKTAKIGSSTQNAVYYSGEAKKYYEWANAEIQMYIQNNSKMINKTMAAQAAAQQRS